MAELSLSLAETVAQAARDLGIETALIGASALAAHNYLRMTSDIDLASTVPPTNLRRLEQWLREQGLQTRLRMPDDQDPLGGVLVVFTAENEEGDPEDPIEVINFLNPHRPRANPAAQAIKNALPLEEGSALRYVRLPDLVALKLYAGGTKDHADIVEVLARAGEVDWEEIKAAATPWDTNHVLDTLIEEAQVERERLKRSRF